MEEAKFETLITTLLPISSINLSQYMPLPEVLRATQITGQRQGLGVHVGATTIAPAPAAACGPSAAPVTSVAGGRAGATRGPGIEALDAAIHRLTHEGRLFLRQPFR